MHPVHPDTVLGQLRWRYATKKFDPARKIPADVWGRLEQALVLAPSSYGLQPFKFVVVTDPAVRKTLQAAAYTQPQVVDASHLVVFAAKNPPAPADVAAYVARTAEVRGVPVESLDGFKQMMLGALSRMSPGEAHQWAARQAFIALGVFLSTAAMLGVDACPMEGFEPPKFDDILGLKATGLGAVVIATAGDRAADDKYGTAPKVRHKHEDVVLRV